MRNKINIQTINRKLFYLIASSFSLLLITCAGNNPNELEPPTGNQNGNDHRFKVPSGPVEGFYDVWVDGQQIKVDTAIVEIAAQDRKENAGGDYYFSGFDIDNEVEVVIRSNKTSMNKTVIRSSDKNVEYTTLNDNMIGIRLNRPSKLSIEPN